MEGGSVDVGKKPAGDEPLAFHSENIRDTKAKEKRAVFLKVEEEKGIKVAAKNLNKKISAGLSDLKTTLNKPITPEKSDNSKKAPKRPLSKKVIALLIAIPVLAGVGYLAYYLIKNPQLTDPSLAAYLTMQENFNEGYAAYQKLINETSSMEKKSELLVKRGYGAVSICSKECLSKAIDDANKAELTSPSADTALLYYYIDKARGNPVAAESWLEASKARGEPSPWWKILDSWNNKS